MDTGGDIVEAMLDSRFPAECAVFFAAVATANGSTTLMDLCTRAHVASRSGARQLAKLRALGIITSTRGNHCLSITINPRDQWTVNGVVSVVGSPSSVLVSSPDIFPDLPEISSAQPAASAVVPPCVGTVLPTADASLSETLQILQSCSFWRDGFTLMDLLGLRVEFPTADFKSLASKFVRKYGKSERAFHPNWKKAKVPDWPARFATHIQYWLDREAGRPLKAPATSSPKPRWPDATESEKQEYRALASLRLRSEGQSEAAIRDKREEYARLIYQGKT